MKQAVFDSVEDLFQALDTSTNTMEEGTLGNTIKNYLVGKLVSSAMKRVYDTYRPVMYRRRWNTGGIADPKATATSIKNGEFETINTSTLIPRRTYNHGSELSIRAYPFRHGGETFYSEFMDRNGQGWIGENFNVTGWIGRGRTPIISEWWLGAEGENSGKYIEKYGYFTIDKKQYKGQSPLAAIIEHGAYNPWNDENYIWEKPRKFVTGAQQDVNKSEKEFLNVLKRYFQTAGFIV